MTLDVNPGSGPFLPALDMMNAWPSRRFGALLSDASWNQMRALAENIATPAHTVCFECRLAEADARVDLAVSIFPNSYSTVQSASLELEHPAAAWVRVRAFLELWASGRSSLTYQIPFVCIAFDMTEPFAKLPAPCLSLCVDAAFFARRLGAGPRPMTGSELTLLMQRCSQLLTGEELSPSAARALELGVAIDCDAEAQHVSLMLPRPGVPLKLDVRLPTAALSRYLARLGFLGRHSPIVDRVAELAPSASHVQLNLVIEPHEENPLLEVEFFAGGATVGFDAKGAFLSKLVEWDLCSSDKARHLLELSASPPRAEVHGRNIGSSWYAKVRFAEGVPRDAKVYFGIMPRVLGNATALA